MLMKFHSALGSSPKPAAVRAGTQVRQTCVPLPPLPLKIKSWFAKALLAQSRHRVAPCTLLKILYSLEPAGAEWPAALLWANTPSGPPHTALARGKTQAAARVEPSGLRKHTRSCICVFVQVLKCVHVSVGVDVCVYVCVGLYMCMCV